MIKEAGVGLFFEKRLKITEKEVGNCSFETIIKGENIVIILIDGVT